MARVKVFATALLLVLLRLLKVEAIHYGDRILPEEATKADGGGRSPPTGSSKVDEGAKSSSLNRHSRGESPNKLSSRDDSWSELSSGSDSRSELSSGSESPALAQDDKTGQIGPQDDRSGSPDTRLGQLGSRPKYLFPRHQRREQKTRYSYPDDSRSRRDPPPLRWRNGSGTKKALRNSTSGYHSFSPPSTHSRDLPQDSIKSPLHSSPEVSYDVFVTADDDAFAGEKEDDVEMNENWSYRHVEDEDDRSNGIEHYTVEVESVDDLGSNSVKESSGSTVEEEEEEEGQEDIGSSAERLEGLQRPTGQKSQRHHRKRGGIRSYRQPSIAGRDRYTASRQAQDRGHPNEARQLGDAEQNHKMNRYFTLYQRPLRSKNVIGQLDPESDDQDIAHLPDMNDERESLSTRTASSRVKEFDALTTKNTIQQVKTVVSVRPTSSSTSGTAVRDPDAHEAANRATTSGEEEFDEPHQEELDTNEFESLADPLASHRIESWFINRTHDVGFAFDATDHGEYNLYQPFTLPSPPTSESPAVNIDINDLLTVATGLRQSKENEPKELLEENVNPWSQWFERTDEPQLRHYLQHRRSSRTAHRTRPKGDHIDQHIFESTQDIIEKSALEQRRTNLFSTVRPVSSTGDGEGTVTVGSVTNDQAVTIRGIAPVAVTARTVTPEGITARIVTPEGVTARTVTPESVTHSSPNWPGWVTSPGLSPGTSFSYVNFRRLPLRTTPEEVMEDMARSSPFEGHFPSTPASFPTREPPASNWEHNPEEMNHNNPDSAGNDGNQPLTEYLLERGKHRLNRQNPKADFRGRETLAPEEHVLPEADEVPRGTRGRGEVSGRQEQLRKEEETSNHKDNFFFDAFEGFLREHGINDETFGKTGSSRSPLRSPAGEHLQEKKFQNNLNTDIREENLSNQGSHFKIHRNQQQNSPNQNSQQHNQPDLSEKSPNQNPQQHNQPDLSEKSPNQNPQQHNQPDLSEKSPNQNPQQQNQPDLRPTEEGFLAQQEIHQFDGPHLFPNQGLSENLHTNEGPPGFTIINHGPPRDIHPNQGPPRDVFPNQGPPRDIFPNQGPPRDIFPNQGPPRDIFPNQGPTRDVFPNQGPPRDIFPNQGPPRDIFPNQGPPRDVSPNQGPPRDIFPNQGPPRDIFPNQGPPRDIFPNQGPPRDIFPNQGPPRDIFPNQGPPRGIFPNQGPPRNLFPNQGPPRDIFQNQGPPRDVFPHQGSPRHIFPNQGLPQDVHPHQGSSRHIFPNQGPPRDLFPNQGPPRDVHPNQGPPQDIHPNQGPLRDIHPNQGPQQDIHPNQGPPRDIHPNQGPQQDIHPNQGPPQAIHPNQGPPQAIHPNQGPPQAIHPNQGPQQDIHPNQGPQQDIHPNQGPPQAIHPNQGPPQAIHPNQGPQQDIHPNQGPPQAIHPNQGRDTRSNQGPLRDILQNQISYRGARLNEALQQDVRPEPGTPRDAGHVKASHSDGPDNESFLQQIAPRETPPHGLGFTQERSPSQSLQIDESQARDHDQMNHHVNEDLRIRNHQSVRPPLEDFPDEDSPVPPFLKSSSPFSLSSEIQPQSLSPSPSFSSLSHSLTNPQLLLRESSFPGCVEDPGTSLPLPQSTSPVAPQSTSSVPLQLHPNPPPSIPPGTSPPSNLPSPPPASSSQVSNSPHPSSAPEDLTAVNTVAFTQEVSGEPPAHTNTPGGRVTNFSPGNSFPRNPSNGVIQVPGKILGNRQTFYQHEERPTIRENRGVRIRTDNKRPQGRQESTTPISNQEIRRPDAIFPINRPSKLQDSEDSRRPLNTQHDSHISQGINNNQETTGQRTHKPQSHQLFIRPPDERFRPPPTTPGNKENQDPLTIQQHRYDGNDNTPGESLLLPETKETEDSIQNPQGGRVLQEHQRPQNSLQPHGFQHFDFPSRRPGSTQHGKRPSSHPPAPPLQPPRLLLPPLRSNPLDFLLFRSRPPHQRRPHVHPHVRAPPSSPLPLQISSNKPPPHPSQIGNQRQPPQTHPSQIGNQRQPPQTHPSQIGNQRQPPQTHPSQIENQRQPPETHLSQIGNQRQPPQIHTSQIGNQRRPPQLHPTRVNHHESQLHSSDNSQPPHTENSRPQGSSDNIHFNNISPLENQFEPDGSFTGESYRFPTGNEIEKDFQPIHDVSQPLPGVSDPQEPRVSESFARMMRHVRYGVDGKPLDIWIPIITKNKSGASVPPPAPAPRSYHGNSDAEDELDIEVDSFDHFEDPFDSGDRYHFDGIYDNKPEEEDLQIQSKHLGSGSPSLLDGKSERGIEIKSEEGTPVTSQAHFVLGSFPGHYTVPDFYKGPRFNVINIPGVNMVATTNK